MEWLGIYALGLFWDRKLWKQKDKIKNPSWELKPSALCLGPRPVCAGSATGDLLSLLLLRPALHEAAQPGAHSEHFLCFEALMEWGNGAVGEASTDEFMVPSGLAALWRNALENPLVLFQTLENPPALQRKGFVLAEICRRLRLEPQEGPTSRCCSCVLSWGWACSSL